MRAVRGSKQGGRLEGGFLFDAFFHHHLVAYQGSEFSPQFTILRDLHNLVIGQQVWQSVEHVSRELLFMLEFYCQLYQALPLESENVSQPREAPFFNCHH